MVAPIDASRDAHTTTSPHLSDDMLRRLRGLLDEELAERRAATAAAGADGEDRDIAEQVAARNAEALAEVELALVRLADGTYGSCEGCGGPIPFERLEAMPSARRCIACPAHGPTGLFG